MRITMKIIGSIVLGVVLLYGGYFLGFIGFKSEEGIYEVTTTYPVGGIVMMIGGVVYMIFAFRTFRWRGEEKKRKEIINKYRRGG